MALTVVDTEYGKVKGIEEGPVIVWRGIRYAKAPVGKLRFHPPQPPETWSDVYDASVFGPVAHQTRMPLFETETETLDEDCLRLNIWSPAADHKMRPVMVFLHGGAFRGGSGQQRVYDGTSFAANGDVVLVTVNYRLGPLGFLYLGGIAGEEYASSGNSGLLDQVAALKWVRDNITGFGGNPNRVTVFGESAGAMSISALLCMPEAKGLFQQAILESGIMLGGLGMYDKASAAKLTHHVLSSAGISPDNWVALLDMPASQLIEATQAIGLWKPMVDGVVIPASFEENMRMGSLHDVPMIVGTNLREIAFYFNRDLNWRNLDDASRIARFNAPFGPFPPLGPFPPEIQRLYVEGREKGELEDSLIQLTTFLAFAGPLQQFIGENTNQSPLWVYRFDWGTRPWKASHAFELPFVFNNVDYPLSQIEGTPEDIRNMASQMHYTWIAFAHHGTPGNEYIPDWPQSNASTRPTLLLDTQSRVVEDPFLEERKVWTQVLKRQ
ncbi:carboxylesterase/lipase family protein [Alicyclobacillus sp. SO9]|uniref:carboxylesterase/lipase family protein n=1 Tax=Alicyclobacillus sp. SO9 TaxID=2665646 RepID=UPI0018E7079C|nr:carboxylesterase/lipase family protein [Alicyclobacillus sp. SO9]QQE77631.1 carboxylesterase/lipase family protein [Alicyclobacillus sp. SO9]